MDMILISKGGTRGLNGYDIYIKGSAASGQDNFKRGMVDSQQFLSDLKQNRVRNFLS